MADAYIQVAVDGGGKKVDTSELTVGANTVERQRVINADSTDPLGLAPVKNEQPSDTDYALIVRQIAEDNAYTQGQLNSLLNIFMKVFQVTAAGGVPALTVQAYQATAANLNCTITGSLTANQSVSVSQVAAVAVANVTGAAAPSVTSQTAALTVAPTQSYHIPAIPMHIYDPGAIVV